MRISRMNRNLVKFAAAAGATILGVGAVPKIQCAEFVELPRAAGHDGIITDGATIWKPSDGPRGAREIWFYDQLNTSKKSVPAFFPRYSGTKVKDGALWLLMEDLTHGMIKPCVVDVKTGFKSWDPDAPAKKSAYEMRKYPQQQTIGFRVSGMRVFNREANDYDVYGRELYKSLRIFEMNKIFYLFLEPLSADARATVLASLLAQLDEMEKWMSEQTQYRFYAASVLLFYDGSPKATDPKVCNRILIQLEWLSLRIACNYFCSHVSRSWTSRTLGQRQSQPQTKSLSLA